MFNDVGIKKLNEYHHLSQNVINLLCIYFTLKLFKNMTVINFCTQYKKNDIQSKHYMIVCLKTT